MLRRGGRSRQGKRPHHRWGTHRRSGHRRARTPARPRPGCAIRSRSGNTSLGPEDTTLRPPQRPDARRSSVSRPSAPTTTRARWTMPRSSVTPTHAPPTVTRSPSGYAGQPRSSLRAGRGWRRGWIGAPRGSSRSFRALGAGPARRGRRRRRSTHTTTAAHPLPSTSSMTPTSSSDRTSPSPRKKWVDSVSEGKSLDSSSRTDTPRAASLIAVRQPAMRPPTTTTSTSFVTPSRVWTPVWARGQNQRTLRSGAPSPSAHGRDPCRLKVHLSAASGRRPGACA